MSYEINPNGVEETSIHVLEQKKFFETGDNEVAVRTGGTGSIIDGIIYDAISVAYPSGTTEVYSYYTGGLVGTLVATVTVIYTNSAKQFISSVERT